jgi:hypothetical protein
MTNDYKFWTMIMHFSPGNFQRPQVSTMHFNHRYKLMMNSLLKKRKCIKYMKILFQILKNPDLMTIQSFLNSMKKKLTKNIRNTKRYKLLKSKGKMNLVKQFLKRKRTFFIELKIQSKYLRLSNVILGGGFGKKAIQLLLMLMKMSLHLRKNCRT